MMPVPPATLPNGAPSDIPPDTPVDTSTSASAPEPELDRAPVQASQPQPAKPLAMPDLGALAYALCPTAAEFIAECAEPGATVLRHRMREARIPADVQVEIVCYPDTVSFLAIVGVGLPDTAALLPLWIRMANAMPRATLRVVDERALPLLERLLGDDLDVDLETIELPMLIVLDEEWHYQGRWGPRPATAETLLDEWLAQHPEYETLAEMDDASDIADSADQSAWAALTEALGLQMRIWYNSGLDAEAAAEILALLVSLQESPREIQE